nr:hypothetical protein [uncultured Dongia sp.]
MTSDILAILLLIGLPLVLLVWLNRRDQARRRHSRSALYALTYDLFQSYRVEQTGADFPTMTGRYRDRDFHLDAIIDTLTFRRLPVLWLRVSLLEALPGMATTDILVRAQNNEFYAPGNDLPYQLPVPAHWPDGTHAKTDDPARAPSRELLERHMDFFALPQAKELLVTPKGVRLVSMIDQGERAEYLVLRIADFRGNQVSAEALRDMMDRCIGLSDDLQGRRKA